MRYEIFNIRWDDGDRIHLFQIASDGGDNENEDYISKEMIFSIGEYENLFLVGADSIPKMTFDEYDEYRDSMD